MSHTRQLLQTSRPKQSKRVRKLKGNLRQLTEQLDLTSNRQRLSGIRIRGPYEPGDTLVDRFVSFMKMTGFNGYHGTCVSREHELLSSSKRDQRLVVQSSGELKLTSSSKVEPCDTSSEILLRYCLICRGLAMEQANILAFTNHDKWLEKILACRLETVPSRL